MSPRYPFSGLITIISTFFRASFPIFSSLPFRISKKQCVIFSGPNSENFALISLAKRWEQIFACSISFLSGGIFYNISSQFLIIFTQTHDKRVTFLLQTDVGPLAARGMANQFLGFEQTRSRKNAPIDRHRIPIFRSSSTRCDCRTETAVVKRICHLILWNAGDLASHGANSMVFFVPHSLENQLNIFINHWNTAISYSLFKNHVHF